MKIVDPALRPDQFSPMCFEEMIDDPRGSEVFELSIDGQSVGELAPLRFNNLEPIVLDDHAECVLPAEGCWNLELCEEDGRLRGNHILCTGARQGDPEHYLTGELAVWATLMVMWEVTGRPRQCG